MIEYYRTQRLNLIYDRPLRNGSFLFMDMF